MIWMMVRPVCGVKTMGSEDLKDIPRSNVQTFGAWQLCSIRSIRDRHFWSFTTPSSREWAWQESQLGYRKSHELIDSRTLSRCHAWIDRFWWMAKLSERFTYFRRKIKWVDAGAVTERATTKKFGIRKGLWHLYSYDETRASKQLHLPRTQSPAAETENESSHTARSCSTWDGRFCLIHFTALPCPLHYQYLLRWIITSTGNNGKILQYMDDLKNGQSNGSQAEVSKILRKSTNQLHIQYMGSKWPKLMVTICDWAEIIKNSENIDSKQRSNSLILKSDVFD